MKFHNDKCVKRLHGLDLFRISSALFVYLFHSQMHIGCSYGYLDRFIDMGAIFMTGFYLLSGYSLFYVYHKIDLSKIENIKTYYCKRIIGIMPLYYAIAVSYVFLLGSETIKQNLLLTPIEILGLQSIFTSIFSFTHNSGTWFVSCLLICYLIYPFIQEITKQIITRTKWQIIAICFFILLWSPLIQIFFSTGSIYANPFFRLLEFLIGVLLCSMKNQLDHCPAIQPLFSWYAVILESTILISGITIASKIGIPKDYMLYSWVALPIFMLMIVSLSGISNSLKFENRIVKYLCSISYAFFFAQFYTWKITNYILSKLETYSNITKIIISFLVCLLIAIILHETIEKPLGKITQKLLFKTKNDK